MESLDPLPAKYTSDDLQLEQTKAEWLQKQLDMADKALLYDSDLTFVVRSHTAMPPPNDIAAPLKHRCSYTIEGLHTIAGIDISFFPDNPEDAVMALTVHSYPDMKIVHKLLRQVRMTEPYIASFLSMREARHCVDIIEELRQNPSVPFPQLFMLDGNGAAHIRSCGLAVAVGVILNVPTVGTAKDYYPIIANSDVAGAAWRHSQKDFKQVCKKTLRQRGDWMGIFNAHGTDYVGAAVLTSPHPDTASALYVSPGHRISLQSSIGVVLECCNTARIPEPVRMADLLGRAEVRRLCALPSSLQQIASSAPPQPQPF